MEIQVELDSNLDYPLEAQKLGKNCPILDLRFIKLYVHHGFYGHEIYAQNKATKSRHILSTNLVILILISSTILVVPIMWRHKFLYLTFNYGLNK